jgi:hypothetical protein
MRFARVVLFVAGAIYLLFGALFLVQPDRSAGWVDLQLGSPSARTEIRAFYGGLEIGLALFLAGCAFSSRWITAGLVALATACACTAAGRIVGMLVDGSSSTIILVSLAVELAIVAVAVVALWRVGHRPAEGTTQ